MWINVSTGLMYGGDCVLGDREATAEEVAAWEVGRTKLLIPTKITKRQAKLHLLALGKYDMVQAAIAQIGPAAQIEWADADFFERSNPLIQAVQVLLNFTEADTDTFFMEASRI